MTAEVALVVAEKTRHVANLVQQGQFSLAVHHLTEVARADQSIFDAVFTNLKDYILKSDLDDLLATVDMVK